MSGQDREPQDEYPETAAVDAEYAAETLQEREKFLEEWSAKPLAEIQQEIRRYRDILVVRGQTHLDGDSDAWKLAVLVAILDEKLSEKK